MPTTCRARGKPRKEHQNRRWCSEPGVASAPKATPKRSLRRRARPVVSPSRGAAATTAAAARRRRCLPSRAL
eukprot:15476130-Alexandrium_andersonii.AAC.1